VEPPSASSPQVEPQAEIPAMGPDEVRRRAGAGVVLVGARAIAVNLIGFAGGIALARLLPPSDFGLVALATGITVSLSLLIDVGLGASLVQRPVPPERADLQTLLGLELVLTSGVAAATAFAALPFGEDGQVIALVVASLPLAAVRVPGFVLMERNLSYRSIAFVETAETIAYFAWGIATVAAGAGVWGLASATLVRAAVGSVSTLLLAHEGVVAPRLSLRRTRSLLAFGIRFQATGAASVLKDQGLNFGVALIDGVRVLGLWSLATRLVQVAFVFAGSLSRVSCPTIARLIEAGVDPRPYVQRGIRLTATGLGVLLVPLVSAAPAFVPSVLGPRWNGVAPVLPPACLGLTIGASASVAIAGYLWAIGDAKTPLRATVVYSVAWVVVGLALLPLLGVAGLGVGWLVAGVLDAYLLGRGMAAHADVRVFEAMLAPIAVGSAAAACGWVLATKGGDTIASAVLAGCVGELLFLATLFVIRRRLLEDLWGLGLQAVRATFSPAGGEA